MVFLHQLPLELPDIRQLALLTTDLLLALSDLLPYLLLTYDFLHPGKGSVASNG
jgi:hypothetical protein